MTTVIVDNFREMRLGGGERCVRTTFEERGRGLRRKKFFTVVTGGRGQRLRARCWERASG